MSADVSLRSVVYGAAGSFEHLALADAKQTLCGKVAEHVNPGVVSRLPTPTDKWSAEYCRICLRRGRALLDV